MLILQLYFETYQNTDLSVSPQSASSPVTAPLHAPWRAARTVPRRRAAHGTSSITRFSTLDARGRPTNLRYMRSRRKHRSRACCCSLGLAARWPLAGRSPSSSPEPARIALPVAPSTAPGMGPSLSRLPARHGSRHGTARTRPGTARLRLPARHGFRHGTLPDQNSFRDSTAPGTSRVGGCRRPRC